MRPFNRSGLRRFQRRQPVLDLQRGAEEPVELVATGGGAFTRAKEPVGELLAIIGQNRADAQRACAFQIAQE